MITYKKYKYENLLEWNRFIEKSLNGTIFHSKTFLNYHIDRSFNDCSLMFYKKNKLIGVFSAAINKDNIMFSHPGASFVGLIYQKSSFDNIMKMIDLIELYAINEGINEITMIPTPTIYSNGDEVLLYALRWKRFVEIEQYYSNIIPIENDKLLQMKKIHRNKSRSHDYYDSIIKKNNLNIKWENNFNSFYPILLENKNKYNSSPTHSLKELQKINKMLPNTIKLLLVYKNDIVKYMSIYLDLMKFWEKKLNNFIYNLNYEKLIENKEKEIQKILNFCNLNWEDDCLNFNKKQNPIKTVSVAQARNAIYKTSLKGYEKYENYLSIFKKIENIT